MKISIVTPSFNQGKFIRRAINSILDQDYPDLELLVMDGGSTDETLSILAEFAERISWRSEADRGQSQAVNNGWRLASGEVLGWINSDDLLLPGALQTVADYFQNHLEAQWLYGKCHYIDAVGRYLRDYPARSYNFDHLVKNVQNFIPQPAVFFRRQALGEIGFLNEDLHFVMDLDFWLRFGLRSPAHYLDVPLACLRVHQDAKSIAAFEKFSRELIEVIQAFFARPDIPENIMRLKRESLSNAFLLAADMNFWAGNLLSARRYAMQSWKLRPFRLRRLTLYLLLGKLGERLVRMNFQNPYEMGIKE